MVIPIGVTKATHPQSAALEVAPTVAFRTRGHAERSRALVLVPVLEVTRVTSLERGSTSYCKATVSDSK